MSADEETFYNTKRLHAVFALAAAAFLTATVWALWSDARRPWKQYQRTFHERFDRGSDRRRAWRPRIEQISLPDLPAANPFRQLGRVDRCTTCHLGIDRAAGRDGEEPYRAHPRLDLFVDEDSPHPMSRFGCTVCHEGQGSATDFAWAGHMPNDVEQEGRWRRQYGWFRNPQWDFPMLPSRFVQSRCLGCHCEANRPGANSSLLRSTGGQAPGGLSSGPATGLCGLPRDGRRCLFDAPEVRTEPSRHCREGGRRLHGGPHSRPAPLPPSTRMPRVFGLDEHLAGQTLAEAQRREELEIQGMVEYLIGVSQIARRSARVVPLSLRERAGVRGIRGNAALQNSEPAPASPHPVLSRRERGTLDRPPRSEESGYSRCRAAWRATDMPISPWQRRSKAPTSAAWAANTVRGAASAGWPIGFAIPLNSRRMRRCRS